MKDVKRVENVIVVNNPVQDHPYAELRKAADEFACKGIAVLAKFTCSHCGERVCGQDMAPIQECPLCGNEHDFKASGGNYRTAQTIPHVKT